MAQVAASAPKAPKGSRDFARSPNFERGDDFLYLGIRAIHSLSMGSERADALGGTSSPMVVPRSRCCRNLRNDVLGRDRD
jgi:hypothetical protein